MEIVKQIKNHPIFLETVTTSILFYKTTDISYKSRELVIRLFLRTLCMIEYVQTWVWVNNIARFTVINVHWEGGDHSSPWNGIHTADKFSMFDLNVQNKPTSSETLSPFSLTWEIVTWEDMRGMVTYWKAILTLRHWHALGKRWWVSSMRHNVTQIYAKYIEFSELIDER